MYTNSKENKNYTTKAKICLINKFNVPTSRDIVRNALERKRKEKNKILIIFAIFYYIFNC